MRDWSWLKPGAIVIAAAAVAIACERSGDEPEVRDVTPPGWSGAAEAAPPLP